MVIRNPEPDPDNAGGGMLPYAFCVLKPFAAFGQKVFLRLGCRFRSATVVNVILRISKDFGHLTFAGKPALDEQTHLYMRQVKEIIIPEHLHQL